MNLKTKSIFYRLNSLSNNETGAYGLKITTTHRQACGCNWQKKTHSEQYWLQKFTPRAARSVWSKINKAKALALIKAGKMSPAGLKEIELAKHDGRWNAAYDSASKASVPSDFQLVLDSNTQAKNFFGTLDSRNRYAVLFRIQTARNTEARAKKILKFVQMLERHEKIHP